MDGTQQDSIGVGDLGAYTDDVPFDWTGADTLATAFDDLADGIDGQKATRARCIEHVLADAEGAWATLFLERATVGMNDAHELVPALRHAAELVRAMKQKAEEEQARREAAWAWREAYDENEQNESWWNKTGDVIRGEEFDPPPAPGPEILEPTIEGQAPSVDPRDSAGVATAASDNGDLIFAARPANMDEAALECGALDRDLRDQQEALLIANSEFLGANRWGTLEVSTLVLSARDWVDANEKDNEFLAVAAEAFRQADQRGADLCYATVGEIGMALAAAGLNIGRFDIQVRWSSAIGGLMTTGFTNDPVSAASGNFYEPEVDLGFGPLLRSLQLRRTYNSLDTSPGPFGTGWSSWATARLKSSASGAIAHLTTPDGAEVAIPLLKGTGPGFEGQVEVDGIGGLVARFPSEGTCWRFDPKGRPVVIDGGPGLGVQLRWEGERLVRMEHERGRWFHLAWEGERIVAVVADDGRRVSYRYNEAGSLVEVDGPAGRRYYEVDAKGLILSVTDGDGVVLARNTYDVERRVVVQETPFGRQVRFWYRPGLVTEVDDDDGGPLNTWVHDAHARLVRVVDGHSNRVSKVYDRRGNVVRVTDRRGATTQYRWDAVGNCRRIEHADGRTVELEWDDQRRCVSAVGPQGATARFTYRGDDRVPTTIEDPEGGVTHQEVVGGLVKKLVDPDGVTLELEHDPQGSVIALTDGTGATTSFEWTEAGQLAATVTPLGHRTEYSYDAGSRVIARRDPDGGVTRIERSPAGRVTAVVTPDGARRQLRHGSHGEVVEEVDPLGEVTSYQWDKHGSVMSKVLPDGGEWAFERDALMELVSVADPGGAIWRREHDAEGALTATVTPTGARRSVVIDELGAIRKVDDGHTAVTFEYDQAGRVVAQVSPDGTSARCSYDHCGRIVSITEATGGVTNFEYLPAGRLGAMVGPTGGRTTYLYDQVGRLCEVGLPTGGRQRLRYDADGRLVKVIGPCGETTRHTYDACSRPLTVRHPNGGITRLSYDIAGRIKTVTDPTGAATRYGYDAAGRLTTVTDPNGGELRYEHDPLGRVIAQTDPLGNRTTYHYDEMGQLLEITDPLGRTTRYGYNADGRLVSRLDPDGTRRWWDWGKPDQLTAWGSERPGRPATEVHLRRDQLGRVTQVTRDGEVVVERCWDAAGDLIAETTPWARMCWERDAAGNVVAATLARPDSGIVTITWKRDLAGRPVVIEDPELGRHTITRDVSGRPVCLSGPALQGDRTWTAGLLTSSTQQVGDQPAVSTDIDHDLTGRVIRQHDGEGKGVSYGYDAAGQLTVVERPDGTWRFDWDAGGRLVREHTPEETRTYDYDAAHQLRRVAGPWGTVDFTWDPCGRRLSETGPHGERRYRWDSYGYLQAVATIASDGTTTTRRLSHDPQGRLTSVDATPVHWDPTQPYGPPWALGAQRMATAGSTILGMVGDTGSLVDSPEGGEPILDPWGAPAAPPAGTAGWQGTSPPAPTAQVAGLRLGQGGELDLDGLSLLGHRAYDPVTRSFLSTDPLPGPVGHPWTTNPYHYAANDPIGHADPLGLQPIGNGQLAALRDSWNSPPWRRYEGYIVAAGLIALGIGLQFIPGVGTVIGGAIIGAAIAGAISAGTQQYFTGDVDYCHVAMDMAIGAAGGGFGGAAAIWTSGMRTAATYGTRAGVDTVVNTLGGIASRRGRGDNPLDSSEMAFDALTGVFSSAGGTAFDNWRAARANNRAIQSLFGPAGEPADTGWPDGWLSSGWPDGHPGLEVRTPGGWVEVAEPWPPRPASFDSAAIDAGNFPDDVVSTATPASHGLRHADPLTPTTTNASDPTSNVPSTRTDDTTRSADDMANLQGGHGVATQTDNATGATSPDSSTAPHGATTPADEAGPPSNSDDAARVTDPTDKAADDAAARIDDASRPVDDVADTADVPDAAAGARSTIDDIDAVDEDITHSTDTATTLAEPKPPLDRRSFVGGSAAQAYGEEVWGDIELAPRQSRAVTRYTSLESHGINRALRQGDPLTGSIADTVRDLDSALAIRAVTEPTTVQRHVSANYPFFFGDGVDITRLPSEDPIPERGYMSTSLDITRVDPLSESGAVMYIDVPPGTPALYMGPGRSEYCDTEMELLLGRGLELKVTDVKKLTKNRWGDHVWLVRAYVVPSSGDATWTNATNPWPPHVQRLLDDHIDPSSLVDKPTNPESDPLDIL